MYDIQRTGGDSVPLWYEDAASQARTSPLPTTPVDVAVIGAGIAGLSVAHQLVVEGHSVVVTDKGKVGSGETGRTTAHLASALDDHYFELEQIHGRDGARLAAESHTAAIASIASLVEHEGIDCGFTHVDGYLVAAQPRDVRQLERELAAAARAGLNVSMAENAPLPFVTGPALRFAQQAQFHPLRYLHGLSRSFVAKGGTLCTGMRVRSIDETKPARVHVDGGGVLTARHVVVATNSPIVDVFAIHTKQAPYRSYAIGMAIEPGTITRALYWDTGDPYHYVRLAADDLLVVGGEDHKVGQSSSPEHAWTRLEEWVRERVKGAGEVRHRWSGQVLEPADGLAYIGRNPGRADNIFIVTGDSGNGMTHGVIAGPVIADAIASRSNPWASLYDPSRKVTRMKAAREFVRENINVARQYGAWLKPREREAPIEPGHGAVLRRGIKPIAMYVDEAGGRHACSAVCPHLGGIVAWNRAERSWDCPCHGSRFDPFGRVLTGPAKRDLAAQEPDDLQRGDHAAEFKVSAE